MSFSQEVKQEIMALKGGSSALLCGAILSSGSLVRNGSGLSFIISSESATFVDFVLGLIKEGMPSARFERREENVSFKQKTRYDLMVDPLSGRQILIDLGILSFEKNGEMIINRTGAAHLTIEREERIDFIKGLFLGSGSISIPEDVDVENISKTLKNSGYHLEWSVQSRQQADLITSLLAEEDIISRMVERNENYVVYIKEAEAIGHVLGLFKAYKAVLKLENERAKREMRNLVNRQANCISANIDKSIAAAMIQLDAIQKIRQTIGIDALPEPLKEVAQARLDHPEGSMIEIIDALPKKISKGALSQRFKKIIALSKEVL